MATSNLDRQILQAVVAHRGASLLLPENTIEAFEAAIDAGADFVELDVRLTSDGVAVVLHDLDVSRTTDGTGFVHNLTIDEVKRLDAAWRRGPRAEVPTLREALAVLSGRVGLNIEIKNVPGEPAFDSPREAAAEEVIHSLEDQGFSGPVLVSSFNWLSIERIQDMTADIPTGFLTGAAIDPRAALVYARSRGHPYVLPQAPALMEAGAAFVEESHVEGLSVGTWTVDDPETMKRLFAMGVDAIATNDPAGAVSVRDGFREGTIASQ
jgi:glycerophosphoryl diester phosphodiesterase